MNTNGYTSSTTIIDHRDLDSTSVD